MKFSAVSGFDDLRKARVAFYVSDREIAHAPATVFLEGASGGYTPTLTNGTNVASSSAAASQFIRIGNRVQVFGSVSVTPTTAGGANTVLSISLPIASNLANATDLSGTGATAAAQRGAAISADTANDQALFAFAAETTSPISFSFTFSYEIL